MPPEKQIDFRTVILKTITFLLLLLLLSINSCNGFLLNLPDRDNPNDPNAPNFESSLLSPPTELDATAGFRSVTLNWADNTGDLETGFVIQRKEETDGSWSDIYSTEPDTSDFTDTGLDIECSYSYRVKAVNDTSESDFSNEAVITTLPLWEKIILGDASDESSFWETAVAVKADGDVFVNYKNGSELNCARLSESNDSLQLEGTSVIDSSFGQFTDLFAYGSDKLTTVFVTGKSNVDGSWIELSSAEFDGSGWINKTTIEAGGYDINGPINTGIHCAISRDSNDSYITVYYYKDYYYSSARRKTLYESSQTGHTLWNAPLNVLAGIEMDPGVELSALSVSPASYGSDTNVYFSYGDVLRFKETAGSGTMDTDPCLYGVAGTPTSDGNFHIIYSAFNDPNYELRYRYGTWNGTAGTTYDESSDCGYYPAIAVNGEDTLYSVFRDEGNDLLIYRYKHKAGTWVSENAGGGSGINGTFPDITADSNGLPVISCYDIDGGKACILRRRE